MIGNLIPFITAEEKSHQIETFLEYMRFHLIETSVLKVTEVKLSSLVWKIRHFKVNF